MINTSIINKFGKVAGWNSLVTRILGRDLVGITAVEYDDSQEKENVYGAGSMPIGQGDGNYTAKASITLTQEERLNLLDSIPRGKRIQDIDPFDQIVSYAYTSKIYKDVIRNCQFMNNGVAINQGDKTTSFKFDLIVTHIDWNV